MSNCEHFEGQALNGRELVHSDQTEEQIGLGLQLNPQELVSWANGNSSSGSLTEEAMVFLILHHRATGNSFLVESLAAVLDKRLRARTDSYAGLLGVPANRELCADAVSSAWILILKYRSAAASGLRSAVAASFITYFVTNCAEFANSTRSHSIRMREFLLRK
jgi:hypothetical protein